MLPRPALCGVHAHFHVSKIKRRGAEAQRNSFLLLSSLRLCASAIIFTPPAPPNPPADLVDPPPRQFLAKPLRQRLPARPNPHDVQLLRPRKFPRNLRHQSLHHPTNVALVVLIPHPHCTL